MKHDGTAIEVHVPEGTSKGEIAAVMVAVPDVAAALAWYEQAFARLGATKRTLEDPDGYCFLRVGEFMLELVSSDVKHPSGLGGSVVYWQFQDFEDTLRLFLSLGCRLHRGPLAIETSQKMAQVLDPWGNPIGIRGHAKKA